MIDIDAVLNDIDKAEADYLGIEDMGEVFALDGLESDFIPQAPVTRNVKRKVVSTHSSRGRVDDASDYQVYDFGDR
ncbi:hypothetical protein ACKF11_12985 [Methylobacillus sp. Pita2]|uniref:hypothetical protein n=1 Tax=Methylobacillus sp. Pita2 TaxID=3383245 RepID=UPI0038B42AFD